MGLQLLKQSKDYIQKQFMKNLEKIMKYKCVVFGTTFNHYPVNLFCLPVNDTSHNQGQATTGILLRPEVPGVDFTLLPVSYPPGQFLDTVSLTRGLCITLKKIYYSVSGSVSTCRRRIIQRLPSVATSFTLNG